VRGREDARVLISALNRPGLSDVFKDDHEMLRHRIVVYDALYAWRARLRGDRNWPPTGYPGAA
jgi:hypothetical protein